VACTWKCADSNALYTGRSIFCLYLTVYNYEAGSTNSTALLFHARCVSVRSTELYILTAVMLTKCKVVFNSVALHKHSESQHIFKFISRVALHWKLLNISFPLTCINIWIIHTWYWFIHDNYLNLRPFSIEP
jgi:hypothetical protein